MDSKIKFHERGMTQSEWDKNNRLMRKEMQEFAKNISPPDEADAKEMASALNELFGSATLCTRVGSQAEYDYVVADLSSRGYELHSDEFVCPLSRKLTFKKACATQQIGYGL